MYNMYLILIILMRLFTVYNVTFNNRNSIGTKQNSMYDAVSYCSISTMIKIFPSERNLVLLYKNSYFQEKLVSLLNKLNTNFTFSLFNSHCDPNVVLSYIVMSNNASDLFTIFDNPSCNIFSQYLIITELLNSTLINFADYLWKQKFAYIVFLVIENDGKMINFYQHKSNCNNCNQKHLKLSLVGSCDYNFFPNIISSESLLPFRDIVCPVNVCTLRFIRVDYGATREELYDFDENETEIAADSYGGCVLEVFAQFYNITLTKEVYVGNYNWFNSVKEMNDGYIDVCFGPTLPNTNLVSHLEKGSSYTFEEFIFIDEVPKSLSTLSSFVMPLRKEVWICLSVATLVYYIFIRLLKIFQEQNYISNHLSYLHLVASYFNQNIRPPDKWGLRVVFGMWLIFTFLINAIYNCNFVSTIINVKPKNMLTTFQELLDSGRRLGGPDVAKEWLEDSKDSIMTSLYNRYEIINPNNLSYALNNQKMIIAQTDYVVLKTGQLNFYILKEKIVSYPLLYYTPKGHPYSARISQFIEKIKAGNVPLLNCPSKFKKNSSNVFKGITMNHLLILFKTVLICHFISSIIFLVECFAYDYINKYINKNSFIY